MPSSNEETMETSRRSIEIETNKAILLETITKELSLVNSLLLEKFNTGGTGDPFIAKEKEKKDSTKNMKLVQEVPVPPVLVVLPQPAAIAPRTILSVSEESATPNKESVDLNGESGCAKLIAQAAQQHDHLDYPQQHSKYQQLYEQQQQLYEQQQQALQQLQQEHQQNHSTMNTNNSYNPSGVTGMHSPQRPFNTPLASIARASNPIDEQRQQHQQQQQQYQQQQIANNHAREILEIDSSDDGSICLTQNTLSPIKKNITSSSITTTTTPPPVPLSPLSKQTRKRKKTSEGTSKAKKKKSYDSNSNSSSSSPEKRKLQREEIHQLELIGPVTSTFISNENCDNNNSDIVPSTNPNTEREVHIASSKILFIVTDIGDSANTGTSPRPTFLDAKSIDSTSNKNRTDDTSSIETNVFDNASNKITMTHEDVRNIAMHFVNERRIAVRDSVKDAVNAAVHEMTARHELIVANKIKELIAKKSSHHPARRLLTSALYHTKAVTTADYPNEILYQKDSNKNMLEGKLQKTLQNEHERFIIELQRKHQSQIDNLRADMEHEKRNHAKALNSNLEASATIFKLMRREKID